jgi:hypothetical protein
MSFRGFRAAFFGFISGQVSADPHDEMRVLDGPRLVGRLLPVS